jgi:hypothetical protein
VSVQGAAVLTTALPTALLGDGRCSRYLLQLSNQPEVECPQSFSLLPDLLCGGLCTSCRVLQVGDASGIQSPLSFGGFGALTRHLRRLLSALDEALAADALQQSDLALVNPYNPGLSSAWMLQRAMTATRSPGRSADPRLINKMLAGNFASMESLGDPVMKPFLQVGGVGLLGERQLGRCWAGVTRCAAVLFSPAVCVQLWSDVHVQTPPLLQGDHTAERWYHALLLCKQA